MKRVVFIVLVIVVIGSCAVQSSTNDAKRIVGTWVPESRFSYSYTLVFNANGTGTFQNSSENGNLFWGISTSGELYLYLYIPDDYDREEGTYYLSPDGKRMIFDGVVYQKR
jgi:hypothetical protein